MSHLSIPPVVQALCDSHVLTMHSHGLINHWLDRYNGNPSDPTDLRILNEAARLVDLSARLMNRRLAINELWRKAAPLPESQRFGMPAVSMPVARPARPRLHAASGLARGRLNNGNPSGDFLQASRCGARTRAGGCCRQPAMKNGRCRMHGGLSTGPKTPDGLRRSRYSRYVHGFRGRPVLEFRRRCVHAARTLRDLAPVLRAALRNPIPAGHGVHRPDSVVAPGFRASRPKIRHGGHRGHRETPPRLSHSGFKNPSSVCSVPSVVKPFPAGQGLHRSNLLSSAARLPEVSASSGIGVHRRSSAVESPSPAGQGVHRPESTSCSVLTCSPLGRKLGGNKRTSVPAWREGIRAA